MVILVNLIKQKPISTNLNINGGAYDLSFSGIADMAKDVPEIQGELAINAKSIKSMAQQFGAKDLKIKDQSFELKGMVNVSSKAASLNNGNIKLGGFGEAMPIKFDFQPTQETGALTLQNMPGKGSIIADIKMGDAMKVSADVKLPSLQSIFVDGLGIVDAKTFDNPQVPNNIEGDVRVILNGDKIKLSSQKNDVR